MRVVGLMSGTSADGIDVAVADLTTTGRTVRLTPLAALDVPYPAALGEDIVDVLPPAGTDVGAIDRLDALIGQALADAACAGIDAVGGGVGLVVSHGQTVHHWVEDGAVRGTLQLGQPAWIAEATGLPVVHDLRSRDVAAGGQGAPLVSRFDALLLAGTRRSAAALNIGGIANVTIVAPQRDPVAFDTGPGNALLDLAVRSGTDGAERHDAGGARAARGEVHDGLLDVLLADPYYDRPPPKSTGKEHYHGAYLDDVLARSGAAALGLDDLLATLTALTATTVADACRAAEVEVLVAAGGGVRNAALMDALRARLPDTDVGTIDAHGIPAGAKEAYAFALLGWLSWHGIPGTVPSCTGAREATVLGSIVPGREGRARAAGDVPAPERLEIVDGGVTA